MKVESEKFLKDLGNHQRIRRKYWLKCLDLQQNIHLVTLSLWLRDKNLIYRIASAKYLEGSKTTSNQLICWSLSWNAKNEIVFYDSCISLTGSYLTLLMFLNSVIVMVLPGVVLLQVRSFTVSQFRYKKKTILNEFWE